MRPDERDVTEITNIVGDLETYADELDGEGWHNAARGCRYAAAEIKRLRTGKFILDAYKDFTPKDLKRRCRELVRIVGRQNMIIAMLVENGGAKGLSGELAREAIKIWSSYDLLEQPD